MRGQHMSEEVETSFQYLFVLVPGGPCIGAEIDHAGLVRVEFQSVLPNYWLRVFQDRRICLQAAAGLDFQPLTPDRL